MTATHDTVQTPAAQDPQEAGYPAPVVSHEPEQPACFSSGSAQWRLRGTAYEVEAEDLGSAISSCIAEHPEAEAVIAARPFAADAPAVLVPGVQDSTQQVAEAAGASGLDIGGAQPYPARETFEERVAQAVEQMKEAEAGELPEALKKVVLGRRIMLPLSDGAVPAAVARRLREALGVGTAAGGSLPGYGFSLPLSHGGALVGRSPELLLRRTGRQVETVPLAGSAPRTGDAQVDAATKERLLDSAKDLREHSYVVSDVVARLRQVCTEVTAPERPEIFETETMLHLGTAIRGTLAGRAGTEGYAAPGVFDLAELLHPTPAVCGTPTRQAREVITAMEEPRGCFTGLVGWQNREGDGETAVTIRCAEITPEAVEVFAGAGIISDSVPAAEAEETLNKMRTVLRALDAEGAAG